MKKYLIFCYFIFFFISSFAQKGWRENEMEVKVFINGSKDAKSLYDLHLIGDIHSTVGYALMYVIPSELEMIKTLNLKYEISKNNLNEYFKNFWNTKAEQYHTCDQIISLMDSLVTAFPSICKKVIQGTSVQGRQISYLKISDSVSVHENEAQIALDGGIHGDEVGGPENLIRFARYICKSYGSNTEITDLINSREIFIYLMDNPDGRVNVSRYNANYIDCNRDFGYMWNGEGNSTAAFSQTETKLLRDFVYNNQFTTHITYHSGAEEIIFPWCYRADQAADYSYFNNQAALYSTSSGYSSLSYLQSYADYPTNGELIDCSYGLNGALSLTMEISNDKQTTDIAGYYQKNVPAMIAMIKNSGYGLEGTITDSIQGNPVAAAIFVNSSFPVYNDTVIGDYHKFVTPGTYTIKVVANNYKTKIISGIAVSAASSTVTNIKMQPKNGRYVYKVAGVAIPGGNTADVANTPAVIGAPDNIYYSLGKSGWIILDMLQPINNISGNDFKVYEGDSTAESYTCYASQSMDGPWTSLGTGTGTNEFDLSNLNQARFIKIVDDGDGTAYASGAGFNLDAIEDFEQNSNIFPVEEENEILVKIFPNPTNSNIIIENKKNKTVRYTLTLRNIQGQEVLFKRIEFAKIYKLDLNNIDNGIYFLTLQNDTEIKIVKIAIQK